HVDASILPTLITSAPPKESQTIKDLMNEV
ncbi:unnamed protein product, partial [Rotaria sordida]